MAAPSVTVVAETGGTTEAEAADRIQNAVRGVARFLKVNHGATASLGLGEVPSGIFAPGQHVRMHLAGHATEVHHRDGQTDVKLNVTRLAVLGPRTISDLIREKRGGD